MRKRFIKSCPNKWIQCKYRRTWSNNL